MLRLPADPLRRRALARVGLAVLALIALVAALALTSGLAAACFVRAFGITFLALPRSEPAALARVHTHDNLPSHAVRSARSTLAKDTIRDRQKERGWTCHPVDNRCQTLWV